MSRSQKDQSVNETTPKVTPRQNDRYQPSTGAQQQGKQPAKAQPPQQGQGKTNKAAGNQQPGKEPGISQPPHRPPGNNKASKNQQTGFSEKDEYAPRSPREDISIDEQEKIKQEAEKKEEMNSRTKAYYDHIQHEMTVEQLRKATRMRNRPQLERLIFRFEDLHITGYDDDLQAAKNMVDVLNCRERLLTATKKKLAVNIVEALQEIDDRDYVSYLQPEVQQAEHVLFVLSKAEERARKSAPSLDAGTLSEVRAYKHPPTHVHRVVQAVLLLLGEHEQRTEDWKECQKLCAPQGQSSISRRMYDFTTETLQPEIVARVKQILGKVDLQKMQETSSGITAYYVWAKGTVEDYEKENDTEGIKPANRGRQRELLPDSPMLSPRKWRVI